MTDKPLDTYIKSPPPVEPKSHYTYLEDQLSKLETVSKAHVVRIADDSATAKALIQQESNARVDGDTAQATYTQTIAAQTLASAQALVATETTARTTADTALASSITSLTATVGTNSSAIISEVSVRATADEALGTRIDNLVLSSGGSAAVIIDSEASARVSADIALGIRIDSLTSTVSGNTSSISTEQTTRATRDDALATQLFTMSSGSSRVYIATSAPSSTGRQPGDVWFDSSTNNYKPFVWARSTPGATTGAYDWRDNSTGTYSNNVGNYAVYTSNISTLTSASSSQASSISALQTTVGNSSAGLVRDVSALTTTVGDTSSGLVRDVSSLTSVTAQQRIYRQNTQPSSTDRKVGDLWYDTGNGNTPYYWNGTSWVVNTDTTRSSQADLTTEQQARTTADTALASSLMSASAGTSRVYTSNPGSSGRQNGDVWIKPEENFKQYVWYNSQWNDNSSGSFSQYVGQLANVTTTANAAYTTAANAKTISDAANTTAGQASSNANTAISTASSASSAATQAQQIANAAQSVANTANTTASAANNTANTANTTAVSAANQVNSLSTTISEGLNTANSRIDTVAATVTSNNTALNTRIDNLTTTVNNNNTTISSTVSNNQTTATTDRSTFANQISSLQSIVGSGVGGGVTLTQSLNTTATTANTAATNASTALSTANSAASQVGGVTSAANNAVSTANAASATANNLSYEWRVQGTIDGVSGGLRLAGAKRVNASTGTVENTTNLIIDANTTINGNLLVNGTIGNTKIADNAVTTNAWSTASGNQTLNITVRAGATVQCFAQCSAGTVDGPSQPYFSDITGSANRPADEDKTIVEKGKIYIDRTINGAVTTISNAIIGRFDNSTTSSNGLYVSGYGYGWNAVFHYVSFGQSLFTVYKNTTSSNQTVTFTARSDFGSPVITMVVTELSK